MNSVKTLENIEISHATPKDLEDVLNLVEEVNDETYGQHDDDTWATNGWRENFIEYLKKRINTKEAVVIIARDTLASEIISCGICVILKDVPSPWAILGQYGFVRSMSTKPSYRSLGLGKLIIDEILNWAHKIGLNNVRLNTSVKAKEFYERAGFEIFPYPAMSIWFDDQEN